MDGLAFGFVTQQHKNIASFQNGIPMGDLSSLVVPFDRNHQSPLGQGISWMVLPHTGAPKQTGDSIKSFRHWVEEWRPAFHEPFQEHVIDRLRVQQICNGVGGQETSEGSTRWEKFPVISLIKMMPVMLGPGRLPQTGQAIPRMTKFCKGFSMPQRPNTSPNVL